MDDGSELSSYSVIIPAYNCSKALERLLRIVSRFDYPKDRYEVLVVDDGSSDGTSSVAIRFGARLIRHSENLGRVMTRETGAKEALHDTLVFIDARCTVEKDLLQAAHELKHLPLMGVGTANKYDSTIERVFYCIRRRVYAPYEPQEKYNPELWITPEAFNGRPKGTGLLIIDRQHFLSCALDDKSQDVNDDTRLLKNIVQQQHILRHTRLSFFYEHRQNWSELLKHTFYRGPKFLDYYLSPGGPLFLPYLAGIAILIFATGLALTTPWFGLLMLIIPLLTMLGAGIYLCEEKSDLPHLLFSFPPIGIAFIAGIIVAQFTRLFHCRHWIQH